MNTKARNAIIKGVAVSVFLAAIGISGFTLEWWVSMFALHTMIHL